MSKCLQIICQIIYDFKTIYDLNGCVTTHKPEDRYASCVNLNTVRVTSYKGKGYKTALRSDFTRQTGWVKHKIVPVKTSTVAGTRATDGITRVDHRARLQYVGGL